MAKATTKTLKTESMFDIIRQRLGGFLGYQFNGKRDLYDAFGYSRLLTVGDLASMYLRGDIASRIIRAFPQATWRDSITIGDDDGDGINPDKKDSFSPFAKACDDFFTLHRVKSFLERADRLSSVGQYGVLYMGFADGQPELPLPTGNQKLLYLAPYGEQNITVSRWDLDKRSPRFGKPLIYTLRTGRATNGQQASAVASFPCHWSRVIHIAEFLDEDESFGTPRLMPVYNRLQDLDKLLGSGSETFWLNARGGLSLSADKDAQLGTAQIEEMKEQAEGWANQLRRTIALQGVKAELMSTPIADPGPNFDALLAVISGAVGVPQRILVGSERGELASSQDENNWAARINERQRNFATPFILRPFIQLMIETGNIVAPHGEWRAEWPDATAMTALNVAQIGERKANALLRYTQAAGAEDVVPYQEFRTDFLGLPPESEYTTDSEEDLDEDDDDVKSAFEGPGGVQATALAGPQVLALTAIIEAVGAKSLTPESAVQLIMVALPTIDEETAKLMVQPMLDLIDDPEPAPPQLALPAPGATGAVDPVPPVPKPPTAPPTPPVVQRVLREVANAAHLTLNSEPRTLYVRRNVLNADVIRKWYKAQGLDPLVPADEMHVTVTYSKKPVDWMKAESDWGSDKDGGITARPGGARQMDLYGSSKLALVLLFNLSDLTWRWRSIMESTGATWDWGDFQPHITITYTFGAALSGVDREEAAAKIKPYTGAIEFGPEIFEELNTTWSDDLVENQKL